MRRRAAGSRPRGSHHARRAGFKRTNDLFGHPVGDKVLCRFAAIIRKY
ncbi:diguanylate cyclase, partial [Mesorhizobium sp. M4B.F.Ca.ET.211.01.1.1]